ncbi:MAG: hypothetical protein FJW32_04405 [Acidobacteria bacterium]|nr:hypothetical protein [Acidobacteriota bacterium]
MTNDAAPDGWTPLHEAAKQGRADAVRALLDSGADPNAREAGDNTYPLHWAAAHRHLEIVRMLLDAGTDPQGAGDDHELDVIGWATYFHPPNGEPGDMPETAQLLAERGARHHIFSALSLGDADLIRAVVRDNPHALDRRMSKFEGRLTPLQFALRSQRRDLVELLISLGSEAPAPLDATEFRERMSALAASVTHVTPMIHAADVIATLDWYIAIGFREVLRLDNFGIAAFGSAEVLINMHGKHGGQTASLWFDTSDAAALYALVEARACHKDMAIDVVEPMNDTFYNARQFAIRDPNGYVVYFIQNL